MTDDNPPILIATDRAHDADAIERALVEEFARVQVSSDPKRCIQDFEMHQPAVLVLAFDTLEKAERYFQNLRQPSAMVRALPHRVVMLCGQEDLREVYELCRKDHFDDFVLYWPRAKETRSLRMAVRRALQQVIAARASGPTARDFAMHLRRLGEPEPTIDDGGAPEEGPAPGLVEMRALRAMAGRCRPLLLVVDDDRFQHKLLGQMLASAKLEQTYAVTAAEAIASLHRRRPDLILMDISLPDVGGIEITRLLKSSPQFATIPVIMITGVGGKTVVVDSLQAGAVDFVVKPLDKSTLLGKVNKVLYGQAAA